MKTETKPVKKADAMTKYQAYLSTLLETSELERTPFQRREGNYKSRIIVSQKKGETMCRVHHCDIKTEDWHQAFNKLSDAMAVASYFAKTHKLKVKLFLKG